MRAVYIDESARDTRFYFFGALIVGDAAARYIESGLDSIGGLLERHIDGFTSTTEFHAHEMFHGSGPWSSVPLGWRVKACELVSKVLERSGAEYVFRGVDLVALRSRYRDPYPAHLLTLAHLLEEVDLRLRDVHGEVALVLADDHHSAASSRRNLVDFRFGRVPGYTQRQLTSIVDSLYFGPSHASRLLQASDVATYFMNRSRTVVERDERARAAVARIIGRIRAITVSEYVWRP